MLREWGTYCLRYIRSDFWLVWFGLVRDEL